MSGYTHSDLSLVRTFEAVASLKSFSEAARLLGISQSTVSDHVRLLEEKVNAKLLNRTTRQTSLTPAGDAMQIYAQSLLRVSDQIARHFGRTQVNTPFRLGLPEDIAFSRLLCLLRLFADCFPHFELSIRTGTTGDLIHMLDDQTLDLVVGKRRVGAQGGRLLWTNPAVWVAHGRTVLSPDQPLPLIAVFAPSILRSMAVEALVEQGRAYRILLECNSFTALRAAFQFGHGVTVGLSNYLPDFVQPILDDASLPVLQPVEVFVESRQGQIAPPAKAFAAFIEDALVRLHSFETTIASD